jgi:hypothetical protein
MEEQRTAEQAVEKFVATGPYTFAQVLVVAKLCARTEKIRLNLDDILHNFPDTELELLLTAKSHCSKRSYSKLFRGIEPFFSLPSAAFARLSSAQLHVYARCIDNSQFGYVFDSTILDHLTPNEKLTYLLLAQTSQQRHMSN